MTTYSDPPQNITEHRSYVAIDDSDAIDDTELLSDRDIQATQEIHDRPRPGCITSIPEAVEAALALGDARNACFHFARAIKAFEQHIGHPLASSELAGAFAQWWARAQRILSNPDRDDNEGSFLSAYARVKVPLGSNPLESAIRRAKAQPFTSEHFGEKACKLISVCKFLQADIGDADFFLSYRDTAKIIGTKDPYSAMNIVALLVQRGVLEITRKGNAAGKANRYRFTKP